MEGNRTQLQTFLFLKKVTYGIGQLKSSLASLE